MAVLIDPDPKPHPFELATQRAGLEVWAVRTPSRGYLAERRSIAALLSRLRPDLIHSHGYRADVQTGWVGHMSPEKGADVLLETLAAAMQEGTP